MCGISGIISRQDRRQDLERSRHVLQHRGPDSFGTMNHRAAEYFASVLHHRLSIIDLTDEANQPFFSKDRNAYLICNGEIYNYIELRQELEAEGVEFRTSSDTEVLLEALLCWGTAKTLEKINGMWAFAFCDLARRKFTFARDRFGVKPLYYFADGESFFFGSEIKAVLALAGRKFPLNKKTATRMLSQHLLESDPEETFFEGISKLPPGHYGELDLNAPRPELRITRYYELKAGELRCDFEEANQQLQALLSDAVALQLRSDVQVGVLLSGGIDSSALACIAQRHVAERGGNPIALLSLTSEGSRYDEGPYISKVEELLGQTAARVDVGDDPLKLLHLLDEVQWFNDEPLTSFSGVAYYLMMRRARELGIKVLLTGQGADELFCGYKKYLAFYLKGLLREGHVADFGKEVVKFGLNGGFIHDVHWSEMQRYVLPRSGMRALGPALGEYEPLSQALGSRSLAERQILDIEQTSIPHLLHYEDRLSMAFSREVRVPYLDHRIVEFALACPDEFKIGTGWSKYILRTAVADFIPSEVAWRKDKNGFGVPQIEWLKLALRPHVERIFNEDCLMYEMGLVDKQALLELYEAYRTSFFNTVPYKKVFSALALEIWLRRYAEYFSDRGAGTMH
jgi:asparagine synthase (glutamine-hydrolysing)